MNKPNPHWTFLTNHAQVLLCIADNRRITARDIALRVGITERAVQRIIADLETSGYIRRHREGRGNVYDIDPDARMRHPAQRGFRIRELLYLLPPDDESEPFQIV
jgi:DNA-binding IclR family transcriptional regulator